MFGLGDGAISIRSGVLISFPSGVCSGSVRV